MDVNELLAAADRSGFTVPGDTPQQRSRRDVTTRETSDGRPRVYRTYVGGRAVLYPASMSLRAAREIYRARQAALASPVAGKPLSSAFASGNPLQQRRQTARRHGTTA